MNKSVVTIFITVAEATVAKNLLRGTFWRDLNSGRTSRVVLITTPEKLPAYRKEFDGEGIFVEALPYSPPSFFEGILIFISRNALRTGTVTMNQMRQYRDGGSRPSLILKRMIWFIFGRSRMLQVLMRALEQLISPSKPLADLFEKYMPTLVFSTVAINAGVDIPLLREAKRRKIFTLGMLRGWDNFTSHGFLRVVPDRMLLQNQYLKAMGVKYHFLSPRAIEVVGFPQNDRYFMRDWIEPRDKFLERLGIDPQKRVILYGAMGDFLFPREGEIADVFEELVESGKLPKDLVMVFRAHPAFKSPLEKMKGMKHVIPDRNAAYLSDRVDSWEMGEKEMAYLMNSVIHSEMVVTSGSTMALDAIALGKTAISVAFEKTPADYWLSARRFRYHYTHYEAMMATGGVRAADNTEELARAINECLANPKMDEEGRACTRREFLEPFDGKSGERIAEAVKEYVLS